MVMSDPLNGCSDIHSNTEGAVLLVERGECSFMTKTLKAQQAGARAVIIADNNINNDHYLIDMVDSNTNAEINIPAAFLMGKNGHLIKNTLRSLGLSQATLNIPVNISQLRLHEIKQPPWLVW